MSLDITKQFDPSSNELKEQSEKLIPKQAPAPAPALPTYDQATADDHVTQTTPPPIRVSPAGDPHVVIVTQPTVLPFGPSPVDVQCPFCHNFCRTRVRSSPTSRTHLIAALLCLFQLYCCVCIPYCMDSCMNANHYCGMCDKYLGTHVR